MQGLGCAHVTDLLLEVFYCLADALGNVLGLAVGGGAVDVGDLFLLV